MRIKLTRMIGPLLVMLIGAIAGSAQQSVPKVSRIRTVQYHGDMAHLLASLAQSDEIVIGLETDPRKPSSKITIKLEEVELRGILDAVVQAEPRYQWREVDGVIQVSPVNRSLSLIDTPIDSFEVQDASSEEAISRLLSLPEVQANVRSMRFNRRPLAPSAGLDGEKRFSLNLHNVDVRQVLTRIAAESGARFWVYRTFPDGSFWIGTAAN